MNKINQTVKLLKLCFRLTTLNPHLILYIAASGLSVAILFAVAASPVIIKSISDQKISPESLTPYMKMVLVSAKREQIASPLVKKVAERAMPPLESQRASYPNASNAQNRAKTSQGVKVYAPTETWRQTEKYESRPNWPVFLPVALVAYFLCTFCMVFFNVALLISVRNLLNGRPSDISVSLSSAWEKRKDIALWAFFSSTVALALDIIKNKADNLLTRWILGGLGDVWKLATFLMVPVLAVEGGKPKQVIERSVRLFKQTWGESISGVVGLWFIELLVMSLGLLTVFYVVISEVFSASFSWWHIIGAFTVLAAAVLVVMLCKMIENVFPMALYIYATEGVIPEEYRDESDGWFVATQAK